MTNDKYQNKIAREVKKNGRTIVMYKYHYQSGRGGTAFISSRGISTPRREFVYEGIMFTDTLSPDDSSRLNQYFTDKSYFEKEEKDSFEIFCSECTKMIVTEHKLNDIDTIYKGYLNPIPE